MKIIITTNETTTTIEGSTTIETIEDIEFAGPSITFDNAKVTVDDHNTGKSHVSHACNVTVDIDCENEAEAVIFPS